MSDDTIKNIEQWAQALLATFGAGERRKFLRQLAIRLRVKAAKNITAQQSPSGDRTRVVYDGSSTRLARVHH